jgi:hypothetical protein
MRTSWRISSSGESTACEISFQTDMAQVPARVRVHPATRHTFMVDCVRGTILIENRGASNRRHNAKDRTHFMNGIAFIASLVLFVGGIALFGYAFNAVGYETLVFSAGILAIVAAIAIPFHVLKRTDS